MHDFMTAATRRHLLARIHILALGGILPSLGEPPDGEADALLLTACSSFADLEAAKLTLFYGPNRVNDDEEREDRIAPLLAAQMETLELICSSPASTSAALRAKSATWQLWDGGELFQRAARHRLLEDRLLVAIFEDLETVL